MKFNEYDLNPGIISSLEKQGFESPTPIQEKAIPVAISGKDIMGLAQTGTGKTGAFVIPLLENLLKDSKARGLRGLVIAPTRELAVQIETVINELGADTRIKSTTIFGGSSMRTQTQKLRAGVDIVVACPGRLIDHMQQRTINLSKIKMLILDEADQMFDMGFLPNIRQIVRFLPEDKQSMLFSATMPPEIKKLAHTILSEPEIIDINKDTPLSLIEHAIYPVSMKQKGDLLEKILKTENVTSAIIFARTKHRTKRLANTLYKAGYDVTSLQGNLSQNKRQEAMKGFRDGKYNIMVATDIAARGLDISAVSHVINYDIPNTTEAYTHRIGRTGRASKTGQAYTFVSPEDNKMVKAIEKSLGKELPKVMLEDFVYKKEERSLSTHRPRNKSNSRKPRGKGDSSRGGSGRGNSSRRGSGSGNSSRENSGTNRGNSGGNSRSANSSKESSGNSRSRRSENSANGNTKSGNTRNANSGNTRSGNNKSGNTRSGNSGNRSSRGRSSSDSGNRA